MELFIIGKELCTNKNGRTTTISGRELPRYNRKEVDDVRYVILQDILSFGGKLVDAIIIKPTISIVVQYSRRKVVEFELRDDRVIMRDGDYLSNEELTYLHYSKIRIGALIFRVLSGVSSNGESCKDDGIDH